MTDLFENNSAQLLVILLAIVTCSVFLFGCGDCECPTQTTQPTDSWLNTPRENREAEEAALWLSGELVAPDFLYRALKSDLDAIRGEYVDSISHLSVEFKCWWIPSIILIEVTEGLRTKILAKEANLVDSLNTQFRATHMDTFRLNVGYYTVVYFKGRLHPQRLAEIYAQYDDVTYADCDTWIGDWSNVYPWQRGDTLTYLFRYGMGDCPVGCSPNQFWYFRRIHDETEYLGVYDTRDGVPHPEWWNEATVAYEEFRNYR